ncbi:MAG: hypothetical protein ACLR5O_03000 [Romboutsia timonensis]|uniref:hypothetical protein n=1 Tax=Romboutsia timonensis TaxID=1776391 RepID=UPI0039A358D0
MSISNPNNFLPKFIAAVAISPKKSPAVLPVEVSSPEEAPPDAEVPPTSGNV